MNEFQFVILCAYIGAFLGICSIISVILVALGCRNIIRRLDKIDSYLTDEPTRQPRDHRFETL